MLKQNDYVLVFDSIVNKVRSTPVHAVAEVACCEAASAFTTEGLPHVWSDGF